MKDWEDIIKERQLSRKAELPESDWNDFLSRRAVHEHAAKKRRRILAAAISIPAVAAVLLLLFLMPVRNTPADQTAPTQLTVDMIKKVKAYHEQSDSSGMTGIDDGDEETVEQLDLLNLGDVAANAVVAKVQTINDSVPFNMVAYKIPEGSSVEDLIRNLPGVQIDSSGNITVNGKAISRILVDGKEFYTTENLIQLTTEMIEKVKAYDKQSNLAQHTGIDIIYEYVDLGLSVKWATCNVGASKPEEVGGLYAWGETETKTDYSFSTYKYCIDGDRYKFSKYNGTDGKTVLEPEDDVAHIKWGGSWRMPTWEEMQELLNQCTWNYTTQNGVEGYRITSKVTGHENNSIFMPFNVYMDSSTIREGEYPAWGEYWSSTLIAGDELPVVNQSEHVWGISFCSDAPMGNGTYRNEGRSIRPVCP